MILGDSLSAAYGIPLEKGWANLLQKRLYDQNYPVKVTNASISGETTSGGLNRAAGLNQQYQPDYVIIELGGNDGLRGITLDEMQNNLRAISHEFGATGSCMLLVQMTLPPNYGKAYISRFEQIYDSLAKEENILLSAFMLNDIADKPELMQADGIHPVASAQHKILDNLWPGIEMLISECDR